MFADRPQTHHISTTWHNNLRVPSSVSLRAPAALHLQPVRQIWLVCDLFGLYVSGLTEQADVFIFQMSFIFNSVDRGLSAFRYLCLNIPRAPFFVAFNIYSRWYFWKDVTTTYWYWWCEWLRCILDWRCRKKTLHFVYSIVFPPSANGFKRLSGSSLCSWLMSVKRKRLKLTAEINIIPMNAYKKMSIVNVHIWSWTWL